MIETVTGPSPRSMIGGGSNLSELIRDQQTNAILRIEGSPSFLNGMPITPQEMPITLNGHTHDHVLTQTDGLKEQPHYPSWQESVQTLEPEQRITANIAFATELLRLYNDDARAFVSTLGDKPLRRASFYEDDKAAKHVFGLLDLYSAQQAGPAEVVRFNNHWGEEGYIVKKHLEGLNEKIAKEKNRVFSEAQTWTDRDRRRITRTTHSYVSKLSEAQRAYLYEQTGLTPERFRETVKRWTATATANAASAFALDGIASTAGAATVAINSNLPEVDLKFALAFLAATYLTWGKELYRNAEANYELLEQTGTSTSATSKFTYERAKNITEKKQMKSVANRLGISTEVLQKVAAHTGFVFWEAVKEIPYYIAAFSAGVLSESSNSEIAFLGGANLGAAGFEHVQAKATHYYLDHKDELAQTASAAHQKISTGLKPIRKTIGAVRTTKDIATHTAGWSMVYAQSLAADGLVYMTRKFPGLKSKTEEAQTE